MNNKLSWFAPHSLSVLRIVAGLLFLAHGIAKHFGFPEVAMQFPEFSPVWFAGWIELLTGVMLILGLWTRMAAFIASGTMAFAYFLAHAPASFFPILNGGDAAILFCFVFLHIAIVGGGNFSIEAKMRKSY